MAGLTALPVLRDFRLVAFDWDGTAVVSRAEQPGALAQSMERLLREGIVLVVITGTNAANVSGQIAPLLSVEARSRLYLMVNRGSEVYAYDSAGDLELLDRREATDAENTALDRAAAEVQRELGRHGIDVQIISNRLNRRKVDLIPEPEWADPPKAQIGELLEAVERRLAPLAGGLGGAIELANEISRREGLTDARITSDVKHIEIGLTDKSDSIAFLMRRLAPARSIRPDEVLIGGDEFGPISGVEGSDYRMVTRLADGATLISVGREPNGTPPGVIHIGGGPENFVRLLDEIDRRDGDVPSVNISTHDPAPAASEGGWEIVTDGYDLAVEASQESLHVLCNGYMGTRGSADELNPARTPRTFVAGLFDGYEAGVEDLVVLPDWTATELWIDGRAWEPWKWTVRSHRRRLDLRALELERELVVEDPDGRVFALTSNRIVSLASRHSAGSRLRLELRSGPDAQVTARAGAQAWEREGALPHVVVTAAGDADGVDMLHTRTPGARVAVDVAQALVASCDGRTGGGAPCDLRAVLRPRAGGAAGVRLHDRDRTPYRDPHRARQSRSGGVLGRTRPRHGGGRMGRISQRAHRGMGGGVACAPTSRSTSPRRSWASGLPSPSWSPLRRRSAAARRWRPRASPATATRVTCSGTPTCS